MIFNKIFSSHMVFAHDKPIRVYGEGKGRGVVEFAKDGKAVQAQDGKWYVEFAPMPCGGPYQLILKSEQNTTILDDIYVGEVYLFSGQSNIEFKLSDSNTSKEAYKSNDKLRCFEVDKITKNGLFSPDDGWVLADKDTVYNWSAIGYLTGFKIAEAKNIAVGVINCNQGASVIESWVPAGTFENIGINISIDDKRINHYYPNYQRWNTDGALYEKQLAQVFPLSLSGVIWYQGEADAFGKEAEVYDRELCELIRVWREAFRDPKLSLYVIQIADYDAAEDKVGWKKVQDAQVRVQTMTDNVITVISKDVCETNNIHPPTKHLLAERIARAIQENI